VIGGTEDMTPVTSKLVGAFPNQYTNLIVQISLSFQCMNNDSPDKWSALLLRMNTDYIADFEQTFVNTSEAHSTKEDLERFAQKWAGYFRYNELPLHMTTLEVYKDRETLVQTMHGIAFQMYLRARSRVDAMDANR
jgi:hypothetical protein